MCLIPSVNTVVTPVDDKILSAYRIYVLKICTGDNSASCVITHETSWNTITLNFFRISPIIFLIWLFGGEKTAGRLG